MGKASVCRSVLFALISLGILEALSNGLMNSTDAVRFFFNGENCSFVHQALSEKIADEFMSHGVQLPDLFEALPSEKVQREFHRELATMRSLCLKLLEEEKVAA